MEHSNGLIHMAERDRLHVTPDLSMRLDCDPRWVEDTLVNETVHVTFERSGPADQRPITFHTAAFKAVFRSRVYWNAHGTWEPFYPDNAGFAIFDDPPIDAMVGEGRYSDEFATLYPGEVWTFSQSVRVSRGDGLPDDTKDGEVLRYFDSGAEVDWWDWGTKDDHRHTAVKLNCFITSDLEEPKDNGGRPRLVVPASNEVLFTFAEKA